MKKRIFAMLIAVVLSISVISSASVVLSAENSIDTTVEGTTKFVPVERTLPLIVDNADLLTDEQESKLTAKIEKIIDEYNEEVAILTITDLEGKSPQDYADDFYDYNGYGYGKEKDGVLVLYKPGEEGDRKLHITTHGKAIRALTDETINDILYGMKYLLVEKSYYEAFNFYVDYCADELKPPSVHWICIPICFGIGFLISFLISKGIESSLRPVKKQHHASTYVRNGSMVVTNSHDVFMYRNVTRTEIPRNDDRDSGGSSTHTSSSGEDHGGGGISF
ncbi:MAG: TPM domain-containing protein [Ruminococcus sp.]|nr:TPM domain-containing protein [Ruminococcus sp.]